MLEEFRKSLSIALAPKEVKQSVTDIFSGTSFVSGRGHTHIGAGPRAGTDNILKSYSHMPWLRATVNKVSDSVGESTWRLFVNTGSEDNKDGSKRAIRNKRLQYSSKTAREAIYKQEKGTEDLKEITEHPLLDLLENGNDRLKGYGVFKTTQMHIDLAGEAFWVLEPNGIGGIESLWPVAPNWVKEFPTTGKPFYVMEISGKRAEIPEDMVISFIDPDPADPYGRGVGTARALSDELETDEYAAKHLKNFFLNGARPDLIISIDGLRREDTTAFETQWNNKHRGFWQSFKPAFLNRKVDVTEVGQSFQNMQMADLRKQERDIIMQVFGLTGQLR